MKKLGRKKPYTEIGIRRLKCYRCEINQAAFQWNACATGNLWTPICLVCDILLNKMVLEFMKVPNAEELISKYESEKLRSLAR